MSKTRGYIALIAVLIIGAAALSISLSLLSLGTDSQRESQVEQQSTQARNFATACVEEALQVLHDTGGTATMGLTVDAGSDGTQMSNTIDATSFIAATSGAVTKLYAKVGAVDASPNNKAQMAIYSGATPTTLLASSAAVTLTANAWNTFTIASTNITAGTTYWLSYNTNGLNSTSNNVRQHTVAANQSRYVTQTYNTWPASWAGTASNYEMSVYADVGSAGSGSSSSLTFPQGGCTYTISAGPTRQIDATGTVGNVVNKIRVTATVGSTSMTILTWQEIP